MGPVSPLGRRRLLGLLEVAGFVAVALWALRDSFGEAVGEGIDLWGTIWFHHWVLDCVRSWTSPGWTAAFYHPEGFALFAQTGNNFLDALVAAPLLAALGSPGHMVPFTALVLVGNALAMRVLLGSLGLSRTAAFAGAVIYGFHPFVMHELAGGRPTQALLWFWPLALKGLLEVEEDSPVWAAGLAGVFLGLQGWTYWFTGHFFLLALGPVLLWRGRGRQRGWWIRMGVAAGACLVLVSPALVPMLGLAAAGEVPGLVRDTALLGLEGIADPMLNWTLLGESPVVMPPLSAGVLLGAVLLSPRWRLWGPAVLLALLLAWGPADLRGGGVGNPLWWVGEQVLPAFSRLVFPYRAWALLSLLGAIAIAELVDRAPGGARRTVVALGLVWLVLPASAKGTDALVSTPVEIPAYVEQVREKPGPVLDLPFPCSDEAVYLQAAHGSPLLGGMTESVEALRPEGLVEGLREDPLLAAAMDLGLGRETEFPDAGTSRVRWIVLHTALLHDSELAAHCWEGDRGVDRALQAIAGLTRLLGPPTVEDELATAWEVQAR